MSQNERKVYNSHWKTYRDALRKGLHATYQLSPEQVRDGLHAAFMLNKPLILR